MPTDLLIGITLKRGTLGRQGTRPAARGCAGGSRREAVDRIDPPRAGRPPALYDVALAKTGRTGASYDVAPV